MPDYDKKKIASGRLKDLVPDTSVLKILEFIERYLEKFPHEESLAAITNEKGLTQELCIFLKRHARREEFFPFIFEKEYMEASEKGNSPAVDIGVIMINSKCYSNRKSFFSIEAKRLCILPGREKEYLVGRMENGNYKECGGVERFKNEIHGKGLKYSAIIGYVQQYDFDYWHTTINSWLDALIAGTIATSSKWSEKDKLMEEYKRSITAKFVPENSRESGSIILIHLWVNLAGSPGKS